MQSVATQRRKTLPSGASNEKKLGLRRRWERSAYFFSNSARCEVQAREIWKHQHILDERRGLFELGRTREVAHQHRRVKSGKVFQRLARIAEHIVNHCGHSASFQNRIASERCVAVGV